jgi:hypothetical protein
MSTIPVQGSPTENSDALNSMMCINSGNCCFKASQPETTIVLVIREVTRQRLFGKKDWQVEVAAMFGIGSTRRPRGRSRSEKNNSLSP